MFLPNDIYTSSGSLKLYHCWTDKVTKFDSSSFYNWEQDDLPILDLEERTHYLWEQLGYPTSSIPGVALVVSADAPASAVVCNKNIFKTVSAAVEALPQVINFPIIIEVANFGSLGDLRLTNHKFGPRGSLEIINRNFTKTVAVMGSIDPISKGLMDTQNPYSNFKYVSGVSGIEYSNLLPYTPKQGLVDSSCISISAAVFSSTYDMRLSANGGNLNAFIKPPLAYSISRGTLSIGGIGITNPYNSNSKILNIKAYEYNAKKFDDVDVRDVSTINPYNLEHKYFANTGISNLTNPEYDTNGLFYGNKLNSIVITNCDGPIFIRNFFLDGQGADKFNSNGVEINNCPNIFLENIVSVRFRKAGLVFNNSNVTLLRGCVAMRNYDFDKGSNRLTDAWNVRKTNINTDSSAILRDDPAGGLVANNSTVTVSSTSSLEFNYMLDKVVSDYYKYTGGSVISKATAASVLRPYPHFYYMFEFSKNANGIVLNNSTLKGGSPEDLFIAGGDSRFGAINLSVECNVGFGIKASNSQILWDGRLYATENLHGIQCDSSVLEVDKLLIALNQQKGIDLINSVMKYNRNRVKPTRQDETDNHFVFSGNGQHLSLVNSKLLPFQASGMNNIYGSMKFLEPIGVSYSPDGALKGGMLPSVNLKNNSEVILVHPQFSRPTDFCLQDQSCRGTEIAATHGSIAILKGSQNDPVKIFGPDERTFQKKLAAVYAGNNSTIEINGPTIIAQYGVDLLAEDSSVINIGPHKDRANGAIDVSSFDLNNPRNHTAVELHSTRACIVVNKLSTLNIKDLGSYNLNWSKSPNGSGILSYLVDYNVAEGALGIEPYVSAGSLQFYPNPNDDQDYSNNVGIDAVDSTSDGFAFDAARGLSYYASAVGTTTGDKASFSGITAGGMCVRALNGSIANVHNVNFPCGWWNASSPIYDSSSAETNPLCSRLFIWNFADNSILRASMLSVSSLWPADSGYHGPSGEWGTSTLPTNTPNTGPVAILDYFGKLKADSYGFPHANVYGRTSHQNYGPFRLYFGVNPAVNTLTNTGTTTFGAPAQVYAQGYQFSSHLMASADPGLINYVSGLYTILHTSTVTDWDGIQRIKVDGSGYYYGKDMIGNPNIQAFLDQSAAETFANAKHCSVGKSNLAKKVQIYLPLNASFIGDSAENAYKNQGKGIKSIDNFDLENED